MITQLYKSLMSNIHSLLTACIAFAYHD